MNEFRNIDAMLTLDISTVECDTINKIVYLGAVDGTIEIASENFKWAHLTDWKNYDFTDPVINDIIVADSLIFFAGGEAIGIYNSNIGVFVETIFKFGDFPTKTAANKLLIHNNSLWVAFDKGVAKIPLDAPNFSPEHWKNYSKSQGLAVEKTHDITSFKDTIFIAQKNHVLKLVDTSFQIVETAECKNITGSKDTLYYSLPFFMKRYGHSVLEFPEWPDKIKGHALVGPADDPTLVIFYQKNNGFALYHRGKYKHIVSNSPISNQFRSMDFDSKGNLWACSDGTVYGLGFMRLKDGNWLNFSQQTRHDIKYIKNYWQIKAFGDGRLFISGWGGGLLIGNPSQNGFIFDTLTNYNSPMVGKFPVIGQSRMDSKGNIWTVHFGETGGPLLFKFDKSNGYKTEINKTLSTDRKFIYLGIDNFNTKWLGSYENSGLYYFNEMDENDPSDDIFGILKTNDGLIENKHNAIEVDKEGMVWIGTTEGVSVIINPSNVLNGRAPIVRTSIDALKGKYVNDIMIDALDNKWFATKDGVWVLDPDGAEVLATINKDNSFLHTNEVLSLASDFNSGKVFIGTIQGLYEVSTLSIAPDISYNIKCYPQPFSIGLHEELTIDGLAADSDIRIVSINGDFVRKIKTRSRKALWDGRDEHGDYVSSGIYLVLADSGSGGTNSIAKIAVKRY
jgi:hypothetical protein